ncbi:hypothetical protein CCP2SC5_1040009 [Azospirillaceae bacterium]
MARDPAPPPRHPKFIKALTENGLSEFHARTWFSQVMIKYDDYITLYFKTKFERDWCSVQYDHIIHRTFQVTSQKGKKIYYEVQESGTSPSKEVVKEL